MRGDVKAGFKHLKESSKNEENKQFFMFTMRMTR